MNYTETIQEIARTMIENFYRKDCSDKTFKAKVTEIVTENKVKVLYCGNAYTVFTSIYCDIGDIVMVCAPCNNWKELYVLLNRTKGKTLRDIYSSLSTVNSNIQTINNRTFYEQQVAAGRQKDVIVSGDSSTYYPVVITGYETRNFWPYLICLGKHLGSQTASYSENHSSGTSSINCGWIFRNGGWDGNGNFIKCLYKQQPYATLLSHVAIGTASANVFVLWLRGGGTQYTITASTQFNVNIYYEKVNLGSTTYPWYVEPKTAIENRGIIDSSGI